MAARVANREASLLEGYVFKPIETDWLCALELSQHQSCISVRHQVFSGGQTDVLLSELSMRINDRSKRSVSSCHGGACLVHADGSVEILNETITEERVRELLVK